VLLKAQHQLSLTSHLTQQQIRQQLHRNTPQRPWSHLQQHRSLLWALLRSLPRQQPLLLNTPIKYQPCQQSRHHPNTVPAVPLAAAVAVAAAKSLVSLLSYRLDSMPPTATVASMQHQTWFGTLPSLHRQHRMLLAALTATQGSQGLVRTWHGAMTACLQL